MKCKTFILFTLITLLFSCHQAPAANPTPDNAYCILGFSAIGWVIDVLFQIKGHHDHQNALHLITALTHDVSKLRQEHKDDHTIIARLVQSDAQKTQQITTLQEEMIELKQMLAENLQSKILKPKQPPPLPPVVQPNKDYRITAFPL